MADVDPNFYVILHNPSLDQQREQGSASRVYHAVTDDSYTVCGRSFKREADEAQRRWEQYFSRASIPPKYEFCTQCDTMLHGTHAEKLDAIAAELGFDRAASRGFTKDELDQILTALRQRDGRDGT